MMNIKDLINAIQSRPKMYVEELRLDYIYYIIIGFLGSNLMNKNACSLDQAYKNYFPNWLLEWVRKNKNEYYEKRSFYWYHILIDVTNSEEEAIMLFFELSDKFFEEEISKS